MLVRYLQNMWECFRGIVNFLKSVKEGRELQNLSLITKNASFVFNAKRSGWQVSPPQSLIGKKSLLTKSILPVL